MFHHHTHSKLMAGSYGKHHQALLTILASLLLSLLLLLPAHASDYSKEKVLEIFNTYQALNADFLHAVQHCKSNSGKSYAELRKEVEAYAWNPLKPALASAQKQVCQLADEKIIRALFKLKLATSNSADEAPSTTLGEMLLCQPNAVASAFKSLSPLEQQKIFPSLQFGFENAASEKTGSDSLIRVVREKLKMLEPKKPSSSGQ